MDWQQLTALAIVGITAGAFLWNRLRPRKLNLSCDTHCGCGASKHSGEGGAIVFRARKGEPVQVMVKLK